MNMLVKNLLTSNNVCNGRRALGTLRFSRFGAPLEVISHDSAKSNNEPKLGELKVSVKASQVLAEDIRTIRGISFANTKTGIAGTTATGIVTGVPHGETEFAVNDAVFVSGSGTWTDTAIVHRRSATKIPNNVVEDAASLPAFLSAWALLHNYQKLSAGDVVVQSNGNSAVGAAVSQIGKSLGLKVISVSDADLSDAKKIKADAGNFTLAIAGQSNSAVRSFVKSLDNNGVVVVYNGIYEPLEKVSGIDIPVGTHIFNNVSICGFDFGSWYSPASKECKAALKSVLDLASAKSLSIKPKVFGAADFSKAFPEAEASGSAVILKF